jgi:hypothetical protein
MLQEHDRNFSIPRQGCRPHKIDHLLILQQTLLEVCDTSTPPETVRGLRSFIGAYKMLSRVLPQCSHLIAPLEEKIGRLKSTDKIVWSNTQLGHLKAAEKALESRKSVALRHQTQPKIIIDFGQITVLVAKDECQTSLMLQEHDRNFSIPRQGCRQSTA